MVLDRSSRYPRGVPAPRPRARRSGLVALAGALVTLLTAGCGREPAAPPAPAAPQVAFGTYRATLALPGGELPFGLELADENGRPVAFLVNGPERVRVTDVRIDGGDVELGMPGYDHRIVARATPEGLTGEARFVRRGGTITPIPFQATPGQTFRFHATPPQSSANVAGRWAVTFTNAEGRTEPAVAEFEQQGTTVTGTFATPTGDHRYIAGELKGNELRLSRFDGGSAFLYRATLTNPDTLEGAIWSGSWSERTWVGRRDPNAKAPSGLTKLKNPDAPLKFSFPDLDGKPVSLDDERFRGKVVLVTIGGSWCPNCHDEAEFLLPYYRDLKDDGLEVVALQFEHFGDFAQAAAANRRFVAKFGIEWPVLIAGTTEADDVVARLPALANFVAYPTMFFVDRQGRVRKIHTGFSGPATGKIHADWKVEFEKTVRGLLAEKA